MDLIADFLGAIGVMWIVTRLIYLFTDRSMRGKKQAGVSFILGILLIVVLMLSMDWFSAEFAIPYFIALFLWFILDFTGVTNKRKKKLEEKEV